MDLLIVELTNVIMCILMFEADVVTMSVDREGFKTSGSVRPGTLWNHRKTEISNDNSSAGYSSVREYMIH